MGPQGCSVLGRKSESLSVLMWFLTRVMTLGQSFHLSESQASNCKTTTQMICGLLLVGLIGEIFKKYILF